MIKRSISIHSHRTSIALEPAFWQVLQQIAHNESLSLQALITKVDNSRQENNLDNNLASALRVYALEWALNHKGKP